MSYIVTEDFRVLSAEQFLIENKNDPDADTRLAFKDQFSTRERAETNARTACEIAVEHARQELLRLKRICTTVRPWEHDRKQILEL